MIRRNPIATVVGLLVLLAVLDLLLLISGYRILIDEERIPAVETTIYQPLRYDTLRCSYFTGRSVQSFEDGNYGPLSFDECPFFYRPYS